MCNHFNHTEDAMNAMLWSSLNSFHEGQPVSFGGRLAYIARIVGDMIWLYGFAQPVRATQLTDYCE